MLIKNVKKNIQILYLISILATSLINTVNLEYLGIGYNPFLYISIILFVVLICMKIAYKDFDHNKHSLFVVLAMFFMGFATLVNIKSYTSSYFLNILIVNLLMIVGLYCLNDKYDFYGKSYLIVITFSNLMSVISFVLYLDNSELAFYGDKLNGLYANPNLGGQVTLLSILCTIYYLKNNIYHRYRLLFIASLILNSLFLIFNFNKNSILILFVLVGFVILKKIIKKQTFKLVYVKLIFFLIIISVFIYVIIHVSSSLDINNYSELEILVNDLSTERYAIWKESLYLFLRKPVFGYGVYNLNFAAHCYIGDYSRIVVRDITACHNIIIQLLIDGGILLFIFFGCFIFKILKGSIKILLSNNFFSKKAFPYIIIVSCLLFAMLDKGIINYIVPVSYYFWTHCTIVSKNNI